MTPEEKQLLLKDLCARLPYGVICDCLHDYHTKASAVDVEDLTVYYPYCDEWESIEYCKPYLRPMSSMTEEEKEELIKNFWGSHTAKDTFEELSWYLSKHLDINELIPKGLALEAPKGMYD